VPDLNSAEVRKIEEDEKIKRHNSNPYEKWQDGKAEKCIGDIWTMIRAQMIFSGRSTPRILWERCIVHSGELKRILPCAANPGFKSPYQMVNDEKVQIKQLKPFGSRSQTASRVPCYRRSVDVFVSMYTPGSGVCSDFSFEIFT
jgi:hypothetical protein